jgi:hypothetical protein
VKKITSFCFLILFPPLFFSPRSSPSFSILHSLLSYLFYFPLSFPFLPRFRYFVSSLFFLLSSSGSTFSFSFSFFGHLMV